MLLLRLILAAVFGAYGYAKWSGGIDRFVALVMTVHLPVPEVSARAVAVLEVGGAVLLALGFITRLVAALLAVEMAVVIATLGWPHGFVGGFAFELTLLTVAVSLTVAGGGAFSLGRSRLSR